MENMPVDVRVKKGLNYFYSDTDIASWDDKN